MDLFFKCFGAHRVLHVLTHSFPTRRSSELVAENRRARYDYAIETVYEAGIALTGTEVKSLRFGEGSIAESYAEVKGEEVWLVNRSEEHTSELQSLMRISYAVFCLKKKIKILKIHKTNTINKPRKK